MPKLIAKHNRGEAKRLGQVCFQEHGSVTENRKCVQAARAVSLSSCLRIGNDQKSSRKITARPRTGLVLHSSNKAAAGGQPSPQPLLLWVHRLWSLQVPNAAAPTAAP